MNGVAGSCSQGSRRPGKPAAIGASAEGHSLLACAGHACQPLPGCQAWSRAAVATAPLPQAVLLGAGPPGGQQRSGRGAHLRPRVLCHLRSRALHLRGGRGGASLLLCCGGHHLSTRLGPSPFCQLAVLLLYRLRLRPGRTPPGHLCGHPQRELGLIGSPEFLVRLGAEAGTVSGARRSEPRACKGVPEPMILLWSYSTSRVRSVQRQGRVAAEAQYQAAQLTPEHRFTSSKHRRRSSITQFSTGMKPQHETLS